MFLFFLACFLLGSPCQLPACRSLLGHCLSPAGSMAAQVPRNQRDTGGPPFASGAPDYRQSRESCVGPWALEPGSLCPLSWSLFSQPSQSWQPPGKGPWLGRVTRVTHAGGEGTAHRPSALIANPLHPQATSQRDKWFIEADLGAGWLGSHSGWGRFHYPGKQHQICGEGGQHTRSSCLLPRKAFCSQDFGPRAAQRQDPRYRSHPLPWGPQQAKGYIWWHRTSSHFVVGWEWGRKDQPTGNPHSHFGYCPLCLHPLDTVSSE